MKKSVHVMILCAALLALQPAAFARGGGGGGGGHGGGGGGGGGFHGGGGGGGFHGGGGGGGGGGHIGGGGGGGHIGGGGGGGHIGGGAPHSSPPVGGGAHVGGPVGGGHVGAPVGGGHVGAPVGGGHVGAPVGGGHVGAPVGGGHVGAPVGGGHVGGGGSHTAPSGKVVDARRAAVRNDRAGRQGAIAHTIAGNRAIRAEFRGAHFPVITRDLARIHSAAFWAPTYALWWDTCVYPGDFVYVGINWYTPMPAWPSDGVWNYVDIESVAINTEFLAREVYTAMDKVAPVNTEYGVRLRKTLAQLEDAAENFDDSVQASDDFSDTLNDLFYLDAALKNAEKTLSGYSQATLVINQMGALRHNVDLMLYSYHQNY